MNYTIKTAYKPNGDQPKAIASIINSLKANEKNTTLMGVTGSGKTFTMANIIAHFNKPAIIMAHNKTLASQLYEEFVEFFPNNAVEYFVSYYDYYQPEAYIPRTDTYIEKDSSINEQIDLMRHSATRSLLERRDTIVVSSVSCIYGLGSPVNYAEMTLTVLKGQKVSMTEIIQRLISLQYERNDFDLVRGKFRVTGEYIDIIPSYTSKIGIKLSFFGNEIEEIFEFDPLTGKKRNKINSINIYANSHFVTPKDVIKNAIVEIKKELNLRLEFFYDHKMILEAQRLEQKTKLDLEMLELTGTCKSIENYSRYLTGRNEGAPPPTLFEYLPKDALLFVDESHVTTPQIRGMYNGDRARKLNLVEHGFRMPSALDNRPLKFEEWDVMRPQTIFVSATPAEFEINASTNIVEQIIRPTGLLDPICEIFPANKQIEHLIGEIRKITALKARILVTTLTKKMAEDLCKYLEEEGIKVKYLHSDIKTLERNEIITELRLGLFDVLIGINLLREGLDIPECALVAILDADKEGFLRSETSLIQTIGRAARNVNGRVLLYADKITNSIDKALKETNRRREIQQQYNEKHNITPKSTIRNIKEIISEEQEEIIHFTNEKQLSTQINKLKDLMYKEASELNFEKAAAIRDKLEKLEHQLLKI